MSAILNRPLFRQNGGEITHADAYPYHGEGPQIVRNPSGLSHGEVGKRLLDATVGMPFELTRGLVTGEMEDPGNWSALNRMTENERADQARIVEDTLNELTPRDRGFVETLLANGVSLERAMGRLRQKLLLERNEIAAETRDYTLPPDAPPYIHPTEAEMFEQVGEPVRTQAEALMEREGYPADFAVPYVRQSQQLFEEERPYSVPELPPEGLLQQPSRFQNGGDVTEPEQGFVERATKDVRRWDFLTKGEERRHRAQLELYNNFSPKQRERVGQLTLEGLNAEDAIFRVWTEAREALGSDMIYRQDPIFSSPPIDEETDIPEGRLTPPPEIEFMGPTYQQGGPVMPQQAMMAPPMGMPAGVSSEDEALLGGVAQLGQDYVQDMMGGLDTADTPEGLINAIRGNDLPLEARYDELAQLVGPEDAQATPESVLALVQPTLMLVDAGVGSLMPGITGETEMMTESGAPTPMGEGVGNLMMAGAPPPDMMMAGAPQNFQKGGRVSPLDRFRQFGGLQGLQQAFPTQAPPAPPALRPMPSTPVQPIGQLAPGGMPSMSPWDFPTTAQPTPVQPIGQLAPGGMSSMSPWDFPTTRDAIIRGKKRRPMPPTPVQPIGQPTPGGMPSAPVPDFPTIWMPPNHPLVPDLLTQTQPTPGEMPSAPVPDFPTTALPLAAQAPVPAAQAQIPPSGQISPFGATGGFSGYLNRLGGLTAPRQIPAMNDLTAHRFKQFGGLQGLRGYNPVSFLQEGGRVSPSARFRQFGGLQGLQQQALNAAPVPYAAMLNQPAAFRTGAKDINYKTPGDAAIRHGMTTGNIFAPGQFLNKFQRDAVQQGIPTGGNRAILANLRSNKNILGQNPEQAGQLRQFLGTGNVLERLRPQFALDAYDWAIREEARKQQTKPPSFLQRAAGPLVSAATANLLGPFSPVAGGLVNRALTGRAPLPPAAQVPVSAAQAQISPAGPMAGLAAQNPFVTLPGGAQGSRDLFLNQLRAGQVSPQLFWKGGPVIQKFQDGTGVKKNGNLIREDIPVFLQYNPLQQVSGLKEYVEDTVPLVSELLMPRRSREQDLQLAFYQGLGKFGQRLASPEEGQRGLSLGASIGAALPDVITPVIETGKQHDVADREMKAVALQLAAQQRKEDIASATTLTSALSKHYGDQYRFTNVDGQIIATNKYNPRDTFSLGNFAGPTRHIVNDRVAEISPEGKVTELADFSDAETGKDIWGGSKDAKIAEFIADNKNNVIAWGEGTLRDPQLANLIEGAIYEKARRSVDRFGNLQAFTVPPWMKEAITKRYGEDEKLTLFLTGNLDDIKSAASLSEATGRKDGGPVVQNFKDGNGVSSEGNPNLDPDLSRGGGDIISGRYNPELAAGLKLPFHTVGNWLVGQLQEVGFAEGDLPFQETAGAKIELTALKGATSRFFTEGAGDGRTLSAEYENLQKEIQAMGGFSTNAKLLLKLKQVRTAIQNEVAKHAHQIAVEDEISRASPQTRQIGADISGEPLTTTKTQLGNAVAKKAEGRDLLKEYDRAINMLEGHLTGDRPSISEILQSIEGP